MKNVFTILILIISINVLSKERVVDLDECLNIALQNHPNIFISLEDYKRAWRNIKKPNLTEV